MERRLQIAAGLVIVMVGSIVWAFVASQPSVSVVEVNDASTYNLLFTSAWWLVPLAAFTGVFTAAFRERIKTRAGITDGKVLRHDEVMFLQHWSIALSTFVLAITGILLGFLFLPRWVHDPAGVGFMLNLHFVSVLLFTFSVFHYGTDLLLMGLPRELMPGQRDIRDSLAQYTAKIGLAERPRVGKYFPTQKVSYPLWAILILGVFGTGLLKVAAHIMSLPAGLMAVMTWTHDVFALLLAGLLLFHVVAGAIVPWSWPLLRSMIGGYVPEDYARKNHPLWIEELVGEEPPAS